MTDLHSKQRFIPFKTNDLITLCTQEGSLSESDIGDFKSVCDLINGLFHFQFHQHLETLKHCYSPVDPDADTQIIFPVSETEKQDRETKLITELKALLNAANFEEITRADLDRAMHKSRYLKFGFRSTLMILNISYSSAVANQPNKKHSSAGSAYRKKTSPSKTTNAWWSTSNIKTKPISISKAEKIYSSPQNPP